MGSIYQVRENEEGERALYKVTSSVEYPTISTSVNSNSTTETASPSAVKEVYGIASTAIRPVTYSEVSPLFYVDAASGSDVNSGLSQGTPLQTLSEALTRHNRYAYTGSGWPIIKLASGHYTSDMLHLGAISFQPFLIEGSGVTSTYIDNNVKSWSWIKLDNLCVRGQVSAEMNNVLVLGQVRIESPSGCSSVFAFKSGVVQWCDGDAANTIIANGSDAVFRAEMGGIIEMGSASISYSISGNVVFSTFLATRNGVIYINNGTIFSGNPTGAKYIANSGGVIENLAGVLPGTAAGSATSPGYYGGA